MSPSVTSTCLLNPSRDGDSATALSSCARAGETSDVPPKPPLAQMMPGGTWWGCVDEQPPHPKPKPGMPQCFISPSLLLISICRNDVLTPKRSNPPKSWAGRMASLGLQGSCAPVPTLHSLQLFLHEFSIRGAGSCCCVWSLPHTPGRKGKAGL